MMAFNQLKLVKVYTFLMQVQLYAVHGPSSSNYLLCLFVLVTTISTYTLSSEKEVKLSFKSEVSQHRKIHPLITNKGLGEAGSYWIKYHEI